VGLPSPPPLLTVREVAQRLRVRPVTVYRLCERSELAHIRVSNAIRIRREDLDQYVARRRGADGG
jgi:excisionase family DNA binding protein